MRYVVLVFVSSAALAASAVILILASFLARPFKRPDGTFPEGVVVEMTSMEHAGWSGSLSPAAPGGVDQLLCELVCLLSV